MNTGSYETDELLHQYLLFHYGEAGEQLPWAFGPCTALGFPARCVDEGVRLDLVPPRGRALDVGCAVGRSSFELARIFAAVIGIDYSDTFIRAASTIQTEGLLGYQLKETGTITRDLVARRPSNGGGTVSFEKGDAHALRKDLGTFDCVLAANLLCRLARPDDFLARLPELVNPGGQLIITTPNTWLESFTAREFWIGATPETGEPLEALTERLQENFRLDQTWDLPFLIREHRRKYQWSVAQGSRWIRLD